MDDFWNVCWVDSEYNLWDGLGDVWGYLFDDLLDDCADDLLDVCVLGRMLFWMNL